MLGVKISGTGHYVPEEVITNEAIAKRLPTTDKWIRERLGIHTRHAARSDEETSDLASQAAWKALVNAGEMPEDMDLIIVATATPDRLAPSTACIVQDKIGAWNASAFDLNAVCTGFLYGLSVGSQFIASGTYKKVLVIGVDIFSRITDWNDRSCVFFGDGAGAVVLTKGEGILAINIYADGRGKEAFSVHNGSYFQMQNKMIYETAPVVLSQSIMTVLEQCDMTVDDIDVVVPHQPSIEILRLMADKIGLPFEKVMTNMDRYANTSAASVPIMLDEACREGRIKNGDTVVLVAVGSGWTWGAALLRWTKEL